MSEEASDLPTELLKERDRVRDHVIPAYEECGPGGAPALMLFIRPALERAEKALKEHDAVEMVRALTELRGLDT